MKQLSFEDLAGLPLVEFYERAFRKATGVTLKLVPPTPCGRASSFFAAGNPFCALAASAPIACATCAETEARVLRMAARKLGRHQMDCYAGLTLVAAPVKVEGRHVATLVSGQVFRREPTERDFLIIARMLDGGLDPDWVRQARKAYFETPVLNTERFQAAVQLLEVFAQYLADTASRQAIARSEAEPEAVTQAKQFVQSHAEEAIELDQVVQHVNVSRYYFCKLFKKATGMTLTEYVARVRVEKAKTLLSDPGRRVSEVVFAAGFGSIPRFNSVFKRFVGVPPTEYRGALRTQNPG